MSPAFTLRSNPVASLLLAFFFSALIEAQGNELPDRSAIVEAMKKAALFFEHELSVEGGYASSWDEATGRGFSEHRDGYAVISIQPHGTTTVGLAMLRAFVETGEALFLDGAEGAVSALVESQLASGGWEADFVFEPDFIEERFLRRHLENGEKKAEKQRDVSSLDDDKTTSALRLLLEFVHTEGVPENESAERALTFGMNSLLGNQYQNGGWPQRFSAPFPSGGPVFAASLPKEWPRQWPNESYGSYVTLNDGNLGNVMELLLRAEILTGESRYREAATRLGDFLLLAQLPAPQRGWAQQYNKRMEPVWARKFEPPAVSSVESFGAAETLRQIWEVTGDERYRSAAIEGLDWIERSRLPDGQWARFYELRTNRALYCEADTYELTYEDDNLPTHYGFTIDGGFARKVERLRERLAMTPEESFQQSQPPQWPSTWEKRAKSLRGKVNDALESSEEEGYWVEKGKIEARRFVQHLTAMTAYLEALRKGSEPK